MENSQKDVELMAKLSFTEFLGLFGFSAFVASSFGVVLFLNQLIPTASSIFALRLIFVCGSLLSFFVSWCASGSISKISFQKPKIFLSFLGIPALCLMMFVDCPYWAQCICMAIMGICFALLAVNWFIYNTAKPSRSVILYYVQAIVGFCLVWIIFYFLSLVVMKCLLVLLCVFGIAILLSNNKKDELEANEFLKVDKKDSDSKSKIRNSSAIMLSATFFEFGYTVQVINYDHLWILFLVAIFVALLLLIDSFHSNKINERTLHPFTTPASLLVLVCLCLFPEPIPTILLCINTAFFTIYLTSGYIALLMHVRLTHLSSVRTMSKARIFNMIGFLIGLFVGALISYLLHSDQLLNAIRVSAVISVIYAAIASSCHKARFPEISLGFADGAQSTGIERKGQWQNRCRSVADKYNLSERQLDVLILISQGRNAEHVSQQLFISVNTVQTHIRNIYNKVGVHSRQELLDLIEQTKLYDED